MADKSNRESIAYARTALLGDLIMGLFGSIWKNFLNLLGAQPRYVATVIASSGSGEYTLQLLGGAEIIARGALGYVINSKVFVTGAVIESQAPSLTSEIIDV